MKRVISLFGILIFGGTASAVAGTILYNNIGDTLTTNSQLTEPLYQSFSTGATSVFMDDLKLLLDVKGIDTGSFTVGLYADNSTAPGTLLLNIAIVTDASLTMTATSYDFPVADFALAASTRYWIGLVPTPTNIEGSWESSNPQGGDTGVTGQFADYGGSVFPVGAATAPAFDMTLDAVSSVTSTPEPSSALLLMGGLAVMFWFARRAA
jgi:hypothetical protein